MPTNNAEDEGARDWPLGLMDLIETHGHLPEVDDVDNVDTDVADALRELHDRAQEQNVFVDELLLTLKRVNSVTDGIPRAEDIRAWDGAVSTQTFEEVFGSIENAVEFALAADAGELTMAITNHYNDS